MQEVMLKDPLPAEPYPAQHILNTYKRNVVRSKTFIGNGINVINCKIEAYIFNLSSN